VCRQCAKTGTYGPDTGLQDGQRTGPDLDSTDRAGLAGQPWRHWQCEGPGRLPLLADSGLRDRMFLAALSGSDSPQAGVVSLLGAGGFGFLIG
jgi:hypothetical protein